MKRIQSIFSIAFLLFTIAKGAAQSITVDDTYTAQQLTENILVNSSCATVSNFSATGRSVPAGQNSYAYFTNGGGSFPFKEGVVLSTHAAKNAIGPYSFNLGNNNDGSWLGDADLNQILGINTVTATTLEFDFIPLTNFLSFDYIFASTEYEDTGSCRYTDGFAFLIKENVPGSVYDNLAVIPGTRTPVSSTDIHPTILKSGIYNGCAAVNENYFNGFNNASSPINYAGQTVIMNSQTPVIAGKSYHIKLVIANDKNEYYDSAVFLKAGSFAPKIDLGSNLTLATNNPVCSGETYLIDTKFPATYTYKWYKDGATIPIPGEIGPTLLVTDSGTYSVDIVFTPATWSATGTIKVEFAPEILLNNTTLTQCDENGDGISVFDLTKADKIIINNDATLSPVVYFESLPDAQGNSNPISNAQAYSNKASKLQIFARVTNSYNCANFATVNLAFANNSIAPQNPIAVCDGDATQDGLYQFDLNSQVTPQVVKGLPSGMIVEYYLSSSDAESQKNTLPNLFKNTSANQQIIYARIINGPDCYGIIKVTLIVNTFDPPNFNDETAAICVGNLANLTVAAGYASYLWNSGETSNSVIASIPGVYTVKVANANGCEKTKKFTVTASESATITEATVTDFSGNSNSILLQFTGVGNYEFSLDDINYQESPLFTGIAPGRYLAYARDKNGCGNSAPYAVYVLDYPRFFTPNGDGFNDTWRIKNLDLFPKSYIIIYNRYGKIVKQLNDSNPEWNGFYRGRELPSDDYWFQIKFDAEKIIKGHFSLKR